ncbi:MAG: NADP-dependent oxidoreductase [Pseudomonadota bacterium]|nr:NADP-dependent oxidoreductase [Pseudomonadota bacterium]MEC9392019.1 NADP-dependent oxidoreductase [Pseudomonadota bacterium]MEC9458932.1 NADP-dependent oxidoreductase [Pseudomonadota bacterium]MED5437555.1 NADP-dependent oxidoreductase [Pseudomonadota bacterium]
MINKKFLLAGRPIGRLISDDDFEYKEEELKEIEEKEVLLENLVIEFQPAQKGWMENISNYVAPLEIGDVMRCSGIARVLESKSKKFKKGEIVTGQTCWQTHAILKEEELEHIEDESMATKYLGALGGTGLTAYFGVTKISKPKPGDTVVVTGAAGGVGSIAGQIFKISGCNVIGIAGGKEKCEMLINEFGFDGAIDYKSEDINKALSKLCPNGADVLYDNVGGRILNECLAHIAMNARIAICGIISRHKTDNSNFGPENYANLIFKRATMEGFIVIDFMSEAGVARKKLKQWIQEGKINCKEDIQEGFENAPNTLKRLFEGKNKGKQLLRISD